ncbi:P-II family nitrogen regulator [Bacillota bacterium LX-D]|nr:P-II family nitrogen regulator [Bacillota bacterium LX-D]
MKMIRAIIRPEKTGIVLSELADAGFPSVTKMDVVGRGKQRGLKVADLYYDELPKEMLLLVVEDENVDELVKIILKTAKTGESGAFGDGKIFISSVETSYTISSGMEEL